MDPVKLIKQDHRTVKGLFRAFERAGRRSEKQRIAEEIIEELSVHAVLEEQLVYPLLRERGRLEQPILNALEEHHAAKLILAELDRMNAGDERFAAKMHVVRESVEMHIAEEESAVLPQLERILSPEEKSQLAEAMTAARELAPNHPHPSAPDTPPEGALSGLFARAADAARDMVRKVTSGDKAAGHRRVVRRAAATARRAIARTRKVTARKRTPGARKRTGAAGKRTTAARKRTGAAGKRAASARTRTASRRGQRGTGGRRRTAARRGAR